MMWDRLRAEQSAPTTTSRRLGTMAAVLASLAGTTVSWAQDSGLNKLLGDTFDEFANQPEQTFDDGTSGPTQAVNANSSEGTPAAGKDGADSDLSYLEDKVHVNEYDLVDLHVNNEDLGNVLQLLSLQSQRNIVASNNVTATVTADLYDVTFEEALDAILNVNGFGYVAKGNFIYVYTAEELAQIEKGARQRVSRTISLNYLNATDASAFVQPLLSPDGKITATTQASPYSVGSGVPVGAEDYASSSILVVFDYQENIDQIISLLEDLDTRPVQVLVEATILQTSLNDANAFGVDFSILNNMDFTDFVDAGPLGAVDDLIKGVGSTLAGGSSTDITVPVDGNGSALQSTVGKTADAGGLKAGIVKEDVAVFLRLLDEVTDVTVVSNPKILTLNRQPARVLVGTKVGYLNTTSTETATTQTVEFLDTGTQLNLRPFVSNDGLIRMELMPQVSSFRLRNATDASGATVTIPDEDTSELQTNVMLHDGETAVLGGLFTETTTATRRQVPVLGDVPVVGAAFRGHEDETRRSEIIFMITPSIVNDTQIANSGNRAQDYLEYTRTGARTGTLPWSMDRRVSRLLQQAERAAREGNHDKAVTKVQWALHLEPQNPSARRLLDELTKTTPPLSGSMLEDILHDDLNLPDVQASVPTANAAFVTPSTTVSVDSAQTGGPEVTEWLLSQDENDPDASTTAFAADPTASDTATGTGEDPWRDETAAAFEDEDFNATSPSVFTAESNPTPWTEDPKAQPEPGEYVYYVYEDGRLVQFRGHAPAEDATETASVDEDTPSGPAPVTDQDFFRGWGDDTFTQVFGPDVEPQPWFFPVHGGMVWLPVPRGFMSEEDAQKMFGSETISTVPTDEVEDFEH